MAGHENHHTELHLHTSLELCLNVDLYAQATMKLVEDAHNSSEAGVSVRTMLLSTLSGEGMSMFEEILTSGHETVAAYSKALKIIDMNTYKQIHIQPLDTVLGVKVSSVYPQQTLEKHNFLLVTLSCIYYQ